MSSSAKATKKSAFSCEPCRRRKVAHSRSALRVESELTNPFVIRSSVVESNPSAGVVRLAMMSVFIDCKL
jgi:hypothetical protein